MTELLNGDLSGTLNGSEDDRHVLADEGLEGNHSAGEDVLELAEGVRDDVQGDVLSSEALCRIIVRS